MVETPSAHLLAASNRGEKFTTWCLRHAWPILIVWAAVWAIVRIPHSGWSWRFLVSGAHALFSAQPLSLFAHHPELQMGPLTFIVSAPFVLLLRGVLGEEAGLLFLTVIGLLIVRELRVLVRTEAPGRDRQWFMVSLLLLPAWSEVAVHWGHLDDALALYCGVLALRLIRTGHPLAASVLLALAVDFKPWAVPFVALILLAPRRQWWLLACLWTVVVLAAWLPFFLGDPTTLSALHFAIHVDPASTLYLSGTRGSTPAWDRYAQIGIGGAVAAIAIWRRRWAAVIVLVIAVRLLLDPGTKNYYDAGFILGAGVVDLTLALTALPYFSIAALVLVYVPSYALEQDPPARSIVRTVGLLLIALGALALPTKAPVAAPDAAPEHERVEV